MDRNIFDQKFFIDKFGKEFEDLILDEDKLYDYFKFLKARFNGDMFPIAPSEKKKLKKEHLEKLYKLFKGIEISSGQTVLFDVYDFSIIPVELISNIYETFLSKESKDSNKSYYTPLFMVDYILNNSLDKLLINSRENSCKILDPACGSGVFLVESLRRIIENEMDIKNSNLENEELNQLVLDNIFGIDKDDDAINISIFSIYLTLLDYQEKKDIKNFRFPELLDSNFSPLDFLF